MNDADEPNGPGPDQPFWTHAQQQEKTPPCQAHCPNSGDIRGWLGIIAQRDKLGLSLEQLIHLLHIVQVLNGTSLGD